MQDRQVDRQKPAHLTPRQRQILDFVTAYISERGIAPSFEEIADHFELRSLATVSEHLQNMRAKGVIEYDYMAARSIRVIARPCALCGYSVAGVTGERPARRGTFAIRTMALLALLLVGCDTTDTTGPRRPDAPKLSTTSVQASGVAIIGASNAGDAGQGACLEGATFLDCGVMGAWIGGGRLMRLDGANGDADSAMIWQQFRDQLPAQFVWFQVAIHGTAADGPHNVRLSAAESNALRNVLQKIQTLAPGTPIFVRREHVRRLPPERPPEHRPRPAPARSRPDRVLRLDGHGAATTAAASFSPAPSTGCVHGRGRGDRGTGRVEGDGGGLLDGGRG